MSRIQSSSKIENRQTAICARMYVQLPQNDMIPYCEAELYTHWTKRNEHEL